MEPSLFYCLCYCRLYCLFYCLFYRLFYCLSVWAEVESSSQLWFDMHSYAELPLKLLPHQSNSEPETVNITFSTLEEDGLLFFHGQTARDRGAGQDYIAIAGACGAGPMALPRCLLGSQYGVRCWYLLGAG